MLIKWIKKKILKSIVKDIAKEYNKNKDKLKKALAYIELHKEDILGKIKESIREIIKAELQNI